MSSDIAFILGAGASRAAGAPLMGGFFEKAKLLKRDGLLGEVSADYDRVHWFRSELQRTAAKTSLDLYNLEAVFGAFEMIEVLGHLGDIAAKDIPSIRASFERLIGATIEASMEFPVEGRDERAHLVAPKGYEEFVSTLHSRLERLKGRRLNLITFNYDIGLDFALYTHHLPFSYGFDKNTNQIGLYKLHGSLNWLQDAKGAIQVVPFPTDHDVRTQLAMSSRRVQRLSMLGGLRRVAQKHGVEPRPYIVAPTDSKLGHRLQIAPVWQSAAEQLANSSVVVVVGFSFPRTDDFFRHFFAIGSTSDTFIERFVVIDPSESAKKRLSSLLSTDVRRRFEWWGSPLLDSIDRIGKLLTDS